MFKGISQKWEIFVLFVIHKLDLISIFVQWMDK